MLLIYDTVTLLMPCHFIFAFAHFQLSYARHRHYAADAMPIRLFRFRRYFRHYAFRSDADFRFLSLSMLHCCHYCCRQPPSR